MKRVIKLSFMILLVLWSCNKEELLEVNEVESEATSANRMPDKIFICHYEAEPQTWKQISVHPNALENHLAHGDMYNEFCPDFRLDEDNDGITNDLEQCPDTPEGEEVDADGCAESQKDDDGDGVTNDIDTCPDTPDGEIPDADGCAESQKDDDGDGVTNDVDTCPDTPDGESPDANGCSDSQNDDDGDGVPNDLDLCPNTPPLNAQEFEVVDQNGCLGYGVTNDASHSQIIGRRNPGTGTSGDRLAQGQSVNLHGDYSLNSFSIKFAMGFSDIGDPDNIVLGNQAELILQLRDASGAIITTLTKIVDDSFQGGWVKFNFNQPQILTASTTYNFTWYIKDSFINNLRSTVDLVRDYDAYNLGTAYGAHTFLEDDSEFDDFSRYTNLPDIYSQYPESDWLFILKGDFIN
ncbi:hypothetical protein A9Q87_13255 [Flavobacteriales bacterium 34_180_T64]|nr:hypothetical protein A9Q87_13255 [Flavobacteriales bacterium 34_180_T64]